MQNDVQAVMLNSFISREEYSENIQKLKDGKAKLLYLAPETLLKARTLNLLKELQIDCFTIDEAHCISEWGHDFRPEYRKIIDIRSDFPDAVCLCLTATATERVRKDIKNSLELSHQFDEFITSFDRKNLYLQFEDKVDGIKQLLNFLNNFKKDSGIIYCTTRKQVNSISSELKKKGFSVKPYHAGLSEKARTSNQDLFIKDDIQIIVATIAFGMGINKSNVRFVVHYDLPQNVESYYQQIGRAGRDGLNSHCLLLFSYSDIYKIKYFINQKSPEEKKIANFHLNHLIGVVETVQCRRIPILKYFGENPEFNKCKHCDNCTSEKKETEDLTVFAQKFLSCVIRTGEIFGTTHIIDVLRGSKAQKVIRFSHDQLSTYNIGADISSKEWFYFFRQFLAQDLLYQDTEHGSIKLNNKSKKILKNELSVQGLRLEEVVKKSKKQKVKYDIDFDQELYDILREERKKIATKKRIAPFMVFSNKTLMEIASVQPRGEAELMNISGIGKAKFKKYSKIVLKIVKEYQGI
ncbi:RecQ family ATP-dependent DNA helicase, partial [bacterium]|nr:RecQ family ATP-dependent DNA helicase [bacterium]